MAFETVIKQFARVARNATARPHGDMPRRPEQNSCPGEGTGRSARESANETSGPAGAAVGATLPASPMLMSTTGDASVERELTKRAAIMSGWGPTLRLKFLSPSAAFTAVVFYGGGVSCAIWIGRLADVLAWVTNGR